MCRSLYLTIRYGDQVEVTKHERVTQGTWTFPHNSICSSKGASAVGASATVKLQFGVRKSALSAKTVLV